MTEDKLQSIITAYNKGNMKIDDIGWLIDQLEAARAENRELKAKSWYPVYEENLRLTNEIKALKIVMGVTNQ
jgi:hypothetical protein